MSQQNRRHRPGRQYAAAHLLLLPTVAAVLAGHLAASTGVAMSPVGPSVEATTSQDNTITEERPEILDPRTARTEAEEDRLSSAAHFAQARLLIQRGKPVLALKHFQRAWRFNPERVALLDRVVRIASELGRSEQAARYAVISAERRPRDARLLIQLGGLLSQQDETARALRMFKKAIELQGETKLTPQGIGIRVEMGRLYFIQEDFEAAASVLAGVRDALDDPQVVSEQQRKALLSKPHALYSLIAASFLESGRLDAAEAMVRKADSFEPDQPRLKFHLAEIAFKKDDTATARTRLKEYLDAKSTVAGMEPYRLLDKICRREQATEDEAKAALLVELEERYELDPENAPLGYFLAARLLAKGALDEALPLYAKLVERQPTADAFQALVKIYRSQKNAPGLWDTIEQIVSKTESLELLGGDDERGEIHNIIADKALLEQLFEIADKKAKSATDKARVTTASAAAYLAIATGDLEAFDRFAEIAVKSAGDQQVPLSIQLGLAVFIAEDAERATRLFESAVDEKPAAETESTLQFYLAGAAQFAGDTEKALEAATRAAELRGDNPRFISRRPWILYQDKQYEKSAQEYLQLIEKYEQDYDVPGAREVCREARLILSNIAVQQNQMDQAEEWLAQVLDEFPEDIGAHNDLGYLWADQGKHLQRSLRMIRRAVTAEPENVAYRDSLGWVYYRLGRFDDAVRELKIATAGDEPDGVILEHLGDAHLGGNASEKAVAAWQQALTAFRKAEETERLSAVEAKIKKHRKD